MADRFLIAPYDQDSGLQTDYKPWLIPDEAFLEILNAYVFRGRVRKRFGSRWIGETSLVSRLRIQVGTITGGSISGNVRTINLDSGMPTGIGQAFSVLNIVFTVYNSASGDQQMLRSDNLSDSATYNLTNSAFTITNTGTPDGTPVYFYPNLPVMGLLTYQQATVSSEFIIGFDTRYAYQYSAGWNRISAQATPGAAVWTGDDTEFFWSTTWTGSDPSQRVFFVTNFNANEPNFMRFYQTQWTNFNPQIDATPNFLNSAQILLPFKNRLVALNTWEGPSGSLPGSNYPARARYSKVGSPLATNAWRQDLPGNGNAIDASTTESIVSAEFVKDRLIVFFEESTWELVYTGNQAYPFTWQQINTELGSESTFSIVPFDKICIGIGNVGIHACNGSNVERIDSKIPNIVFDIHNVNQSTERVYGIRDYYVEMIYWTFPDTQADRNYPYPRRVLVYNYKNNTWAFNDDSITCFGYFQPIRGITWDSETVTWDDSTSWDGGSIQANFRQVVAGNQEGYTFICDVNEPTNAAVLQITNMVSSSTNTTLAVIQHNLRVGDYIYITGAVYSDLSNGLNDQIFQVVTVNDPNTILVMAAFTGTYTGGGLISRVSKISIKTKEYNFYAKQGRNAYISKVDFMVDRTDAGQIQVDFYVSTALTPLLEDSAGNGVLLGTGTLDMFAYTVFNGTPAPIPFEATAVRLWHPVYFQADGEVVQLQLIFNDSQMTNTAIRESGFALHAMCIYATATSYRFQ